MPNPVVHFEINGRDGKALQEYYASLFGWEISADNPIQYGIVMPGGGRGIGGGISGDSEPLVTFYVEVDDPQAYLEKAVALGGRVVQAVTEVPGMVIFGRFADTEGNVVGVVKAGYPQ
jgi:uncharacterized protein